MSFQDKVKASFRKVRQDFDTIRIHFSDWISFLRYNQTIAEKRIEALEQRVEQLEKQQVVVTY